MLKKQISTTENGENAKNIIVFTLLITSAFPWYLMTCRLLNKITIELSLGYYETLGIWALNFISVSSSAIIGAIFTSKISDLKRFFILWTFAGIFSSFSLFLINTGTPLSVFIIAFLWGFSFGLGIPACMAYYADNTLIEKRGRVGGIIFLFFNMSFFLLTLTVVGGTIVQILALSGWRTLGLIACSMNGKRELPAEEKIPSYCFIIKTRTFFMYFISWIMFSLVNYLSMPILNNFFGENFARWSALIEGALAGIFALISGFLCDTMGRKRIIIAGFIMLGIGYAALGLFPQIIFTWYFYTVVDAVALGIFGATFFTALWGDLSYNMPSDKYYALGMLPPLLSGLLQTLVSQELAESVPIYGIFSLASFFLFLAVIPLMYAPETLPEKLIRRRELRKYVEEAKKIREKYAKEES